MIGSVILSLIYGPLAVTLGCWLFFAFRLLCTNAGGPQQDRCAVFGSG